MAEQVRVGGQALADGVLMRTDRAWAIARADGSVELGAVRPRTAAGVPVLRVVTALSGGLSLGMGRGLLGRGSGRRGVSAANRRFLYVIAGVELLSIALSFAFAGTRLTGIASATALAVPWLATLLVLRLAAPAALWRYHGAEHKAVTAYEAGLDIADVSSVMGSSRVHNRCGTNLVFLLMLVAGPLGDVPAVLQIPAVLLAIASAAEVVSLAARRPSAVAGRLLLAGGRGLQRWITTAEPTAAEQQVGCRALAACIAEHARLTAGAPDIAMRIT
ncbi:MAG TPA: DUF1385 domain-containing protein [Acidimicrobiales bacterium]|nr:DUF1385 domain-containing protein [Acidimicrobiales bacterium]